MPIFLDNWKKISEKEIPAEKKGSAKRRYKNHKSKKVFIETIGLKGKDKVKTNARIIDIEKNRAKKEIKKSAFFFSLFEK